MEKTQKEELRTLLKLPMTREQYLLKYKDDSDVLALITTLEETDEKMKKMEIDIGKMSLVLKCFAERGNWKQNKIFGANETHSVFLLGHGKIGAELVNYLANSMGLM